MASRDGAGRSGAVAAAFQGAAGAFSEAAAVALVGERASTLPCTRFEEVFDAVELGRAACAVVPVENTLAGTVHAVVDLLLARDLVIVGETVLRIAHTLIGTPESSLTGVRRVLSHPVALRQCTAFFEARPDVEAVPVFDTAGAVEMIVRAGDPADAAIAGERAAEVYGGKILARNLEDDPANFTRFVRVVRRDTVPLRFDDGIGGVKTTIVFTVANRPGALLDCLQPFASRGIDLAKLESRPLRGSPFEYAFLADLVGDAAESDVGAALADLEQLTRSLRVLGSYPSAGSSYPGDAAV
jgi:prephenate dehydratase